MLCCGDIVGYGASPVEVTEWAMRHLQAAVRGNHDKVAAGLEEPEGYNPVATTSLAWTNRMLSAPELAWLRALPQGPLAHADLFLIHGSPKDEDIYLVQEMDVYGLDEFLPGPLCFFGHTHRQGGFSFLRGSVRSLPQVPLGKHRLQLPLEETTSYLINPGSVGQPRDNDARAAYCLYDSDARLLEYRRVRYDIDAAACAITAAGLPEILARRLSLGR